MTTRKRIRPTITKIGIEAIERYHVRDRVAGRTHHFQMIADIRLIPQPGMILWDRFHKQPHRGQFICKVFSTYPDPENPFYLHGHVFTITQACAPGGRRNVPHEDYESALQYCYKWINRRFHYRLKTEA